MIDQGLIAPFLGALQACVSVLLTMCYGVTGRRLRLIHDSTINGMAVLGDKLFLLALIVVILRKHLDMGTALNYIPVLRQPLRVWAGIYTFISIGIGHLVSRMFQLPQLVTPACAFNNTTSLPLLLLQSLDSVGILQVILRKGEDAMEEIERAQSYFLVCAVVSKTIAYTSARRRRTAHREHLAAAPAGPEGAQQVVSNRMQCWSHWLGSLFPHRMKQELMAAFGDPFADLAVGCTLLGALLGLVRALHRAFFARDEDGGIFHAWPNDQRTKHGAPLHDVADLHGWVKTGLRVITTIFLVRLMVWPALSISLVYGLAWWTALLGDDPMLWFSMMLMPVGPPALVISGLAELAQESESEKMAIAKTLAAPLRLLDWAKLLIGPDHVCPDAVRVLYDHGAFKGVGGGLAGPPDGAMTSTLHDRDRRHSIFNQFHRTTDTSWQKGRLDVTHH
ncbi:Auxin efflux carrier [Penicillium argentinense]|uniref:Auxin efflux carrier n=1 Tax=Penicillium argentinense TaxID=1131581 RepID=A0A9W9K0Y7_9EURO|nr:Auxin efflux carrier [Penicillium argentinense]KAJ5089053.1 Auxin efflux carrier [Penicillium argentinense]